MNTPLALAGTRIISGVLTIATLITPLAIRAQTANSSAESKPAASLPPAKEILERFAKAVGGTASFDKITSQHIKGKLTMAGQGIAGDLEIFAKRPDKVVMKVNVPGIGDIIQGFDGKNGWSLNPITGPMLLEGKMLEQFREESGFDAGLHPETEFKSMETLEKTTFDGKECYKLKVVRPSGQEVTQYYELSTGLLAGSSQVQETPLGAIPVTASVTDYKKFGDILFATKLTQKLGPLTQVMTFDSMDFAAVPDSKFDLPDAIKPLIK